MPLYQYSCEVGGYLDGEVRAKNKEEAIAKAVIEIECEGLHPLGKIELYRVPKEDEHHYE